jgi:hypothetical protein
MTCIEGIGSRCHVAPRQPGRRIRRSVAAGQQSRRIHSAQHSDRGGNVGVSEQTRTRACSQRGESRPDRRDLTTLLPTTARWSAQRRLVRSFVLTHVRADRPPSTRAPVEDAESMEVRLAFVAGDGRLAATGSASLLREAPGMISVPVETNVSPHRSVSPLCPIPPFRDSDA